MTAVKANAILSPTRIQKEAKCFVLYQPKLYGLVAFKITRTGEMYAKVRCSILSPVQTPIPL